MPRFDALLSWFRTSFQTEDPLLQRIELIRGQRLHATNPRVQVFARRRGVSIGS